MQDPRRLKSRERLNRSVAVMAAANKTVWGIHTMDDPLFLNQNLIAIGWEEMGDLSGIHTSRDAYKEKYIAA